MKHERLTSLIGTFRDPTGLQCPLTSSCATTSVSIASEYLTLFSFIEERSTNVNSLIMLEDTKQRF